MPSYRPQASTSHSHCDHSWAVSWANGSPAGLGKMITGSVSAPSAACPSARTAAKASAHGSGFITMPAPPPSGVSSTVRWRSWVQLRRSWTCRSTSPSRRALPIRESSSGARYSGKMVRTSMRTAGSALRPGGAGGLRLGALLVLGQRVEQPAGRIGDDDAGLEVDLGHELLDQRQLHASPVGGAHDEEVLRRVVVHARDDAELAPVDVADGEALELRGIPGIGVLCGLLLGVDRDLEVHPAQGLGVGAVRDLLEARVPALLLEARAGHGEGAGAAGDLDLERGAGAQPFLGLVGAQ